MTARVPQRRHILATARLRWPESAPAAGAKLSRLAVLGRAGLRVPTGFVVTAEAFERHLVATGVAARIPALLAAATDPGNSAALAAASTELNRLILRTPPAEDLRAEITAGYAAQCRRHGPAVAVRSSAAAEDGAERSYAGVFESFLGMRGPDAVLDAVHRCWAGVFSHRALAYRAHVGAVASPPVMAVGVVGMVSGRASGVAFSLHPVTGRRDRIVIESALGPGGAVVPGGSVPERVEVDKGDGRVLRRKRGTAETSRVLSDHEIALVADAVRRAEAVFGHPVDIEWAVDARHRVWVLQARPVTAAGPTFDDADDGRDGWDPTLFLDRL